MYVLSQCVSVGALPGKLLGGWEAMRASLPKGKVGNSAGRNLKASHYLRGVNGKNTACRQLVREKKDKQIRALLLPCKPWEKEEISGVERKSSLFDLHPSLQGVSLRPGSGIKLSEFGSPLLLHTATRDSQNGA